METNGCELFINKIVSRYAKSSFSSSSSSEDKTNPSGQDEFWPWLCPLLDDENMLKCLLTSQRKDYYGVLEAVKKEYLVKCGKSK